MKKIKPLPRRVWSDLVRRALAEDLGPGDITTQAIARPRDKVRARISIQAQGIVAGLPAAREVFRRLDRRIKVRVLTKEGARVRRGQAVLRLEGPAGPLLSGERVALNFLGLCSGIATRTASFVAAARGTRARIMDTRKTPPGLRLLVKYAVRAGGGDNHRAGLYDAVLIKDNHIALAGGSLGEAVRRVRRRWGRRFPVMVEAENLPQVRAALIERADIILLDNLSGVRLRQALRLARGQARCEVSGGLDLCAARRAARLGADRISVGAITHSAPWLPLHLEVE